MVTLLDLLRGRLSDLVVLVDPFGLPLPLPVRRMGAPELAREVMTRRTLGHPGSLLVLGPPAAESEVEVLARHTVLCATSLPEATRGGVHGHGGPAGLTVLRSVDLLVEIVTPTLAHVLKDRRGRNDVAINFDLPEPSCWTERPSL